MKKQQQERSARYRFWRNVGIITVSGLIGESLVLTGIFGSEKPLEIQSFFGKEGLLWDSILLFSYRVYGHDSLTNKREKSPSKMLQIEDEEEAYHYDIQEGKTVWVSDHFKGVMILAILLVIIFYSQWVYMDRPSTGHLAFYLWRLYHALSLSCLDCPIFPIGYLLSQDLPSDLWKTDSPQCQCQGSA